jgi:hypothetical protein
MARPSATISLSGGAVVRAESGLNTMCRLASAITGFTLPLIQSISSRAAR